MGGQHQPKNTLGSLENRTHSYALEWFSEAESPPIRSAVKFCFDLDVRNFFQLYQKYFFFPEFLLEFFQISIFIFHFQIEEKNLKFLQKIWKFPKFSEKISIKIFFGKVGKFFGYQGRSKISLRIEWKHSQPLKTTLNHSYCQNTYFLMIFYKPFVSVLMVFPGIWLLFRSKNYVDFAAKNINFLKNEEYTSLKNLIC